MITSYNTDYFYSSDILHQLSKLSGKPVMHLKIEKEKSDEIWDFYYDKADNTVITSLRSKGEVYCYFLDVKQAFDAFNEWFPQESDLTEEEKDFYVAVHLVDVSSGVDVVNGSQV